MNALAPSAPVARSIPYGPGPRHTLDVYAPADGPGPHPVALFLYGGSWDTGDKSVYRFVGASLAARGFVVVIPDYRLYPEVRYPDFLTDCAQAVLWTRTRAQDFGGDGRPPFVIGHSAGAYNAAMLALDGRWLHEVGLHPQRDLRGLVGIAGPYDFLPLDTDRLRQIFAPAVPIVSSQPIVHVGTGPAPPVLLLAGTADRTVLPGNTLRLAGALSTHGVPVQHRLYKGVDHITIVGAFAGSLRFLAPTLRDTVAFMRPTPADAPPVNN
ncbi:alpha/beta hydrolase [Lichenicoccus roseus]|uniref:alpha/beta hydrolase n=1 Tax=Lichenicoccus roseus TaxID=2683649 RepID=UPI00197DEF29|nr:alpha/beta hydrolase [Lichenicoccus roseus]